VSGRACGEAASTSGGQGRWSKAAEQAEAEAAEQAEVEQAEGGGRSRRRPRAVEQAEQEEAVTVGPAAVGMGKDSRAPEDATPPPPSYNTRPETIFTSG
jgi:hypothetical protein